MMLGLFVDFRSEEMCSLDHRAPAICEHIVPIYFYTFIDCQFHSKAFVRIISSVSMTRVTFLNALT